jgi:hypothetical protein
VDLEKICAGGAVMKKILLFIMIFVFILSVILSGCDDSSNSNNNNNPILPTTGTRFIINYDGEPNHEHGNDGNGLDCEYLVYFNKNRLQSYINGRLMGVRVFYNDHPANPATQVFTIEVFGPNTSAAPGTELYNQDHTLNKGWNDIMLPTPINIDDKTEIWAGYIVNQKYWPVSYDNGPLKPGVNFIYGIVKTMGYNMNIRLIIDK